MHVGNPGVRGAPAHGVSLWPVRAGSKRAGVEFARGRRVTLGGVGRAQLAVGVSAIPTIIAAAVVASMSA